jgi:hypothetical protein
MVTSNEIKVGEIYAFRSQFDCGKSYLVKVLDVFLAGIQQQTFILVELLGTKERTILEQFQVMTSCTTLDRISELYNAYLTNTDDEFYKEQFKEISNILATMPYFNLSPV